MKTCSPAYARTGYRIKPALSLGISSGIALLLLCAGAWASTRDASAQADTMTYEGAPPTIPHSTQWAGDCLKCHGWDMDAAIRTTHADRRNCTQCHTTSAHIEHRVFMDVDPHRFQPGWVSGVTSSKAQRRNVSKKPPEIPHTLIGRKDCLSCHSPEKSANMATTHPDRQNCMQCHTVPYFRDRTRMIDTRLRILE